MFSGIITHTGKISLIKKNKKNCIIKIKSKMNFNKKEIGSSISCSGTCLTLVSFKKNMAEYYMSKETLKKTNFKLIQKNNFENNSYDHSIVHSNNTKIFYNLEMSLCSWKNTFQLDIFGSKGSAHIINLCKWGNSKLIIRKRKLPSGVPSEKIIIKKKGDLTWIKEKKFFENLIKKNETSFYKDIFISNQLFSLKV